MRSGWQRPPTRRLVRVLEERDEATIVTEVQEQIRHSVHEVLRRLT